MYHSFYPLVMLLTDLLKGKGEIAPFNKSLKITIPLLPRDFRAGESCLYFHKQLWIQEIVWICFLTWKSSRHRGKQSVCPTKQANVLKVQILGVIFKLGPTGRRWRRQHVYRSPAVADDPLNPAAQTGSGPEGVRSPAGQNWGQKA